MSATQDSIGIKPDHHRVDGEFAKPSEADYKQGAGLGAASPVSGGPRQTSKGATYPWTADRPVNAKNVKGTVQKPSTVQPID